jgi:hypothetical protein
MADGKQPIGKRAQARNHAAVMAALRDAPGLSDASKKQFVRKLEQWLEITQHTDVLRVLRDPEGSYRRFEAAGDVSHTHANVHTYLSAVLALFKHVPWLKEKYPEAAFAWQALRHDNYRHIKDRYLDNQPTQRQRDAFVPLREVLRVRDGLPRGSVDRLLLSMYTDIPPARGGDFHAVRLLDKAPTTDEDSPGNYIVTGSKGKSCRLVINEFKTRKHYDPIVHELPPSLCEELAISLRDRPRDYLFGPFSRSAFSTWANRRLHRLFGRRVTLTMLRHLYVMALDFNRLSSRQLLEIGNSMGHRMEMQKQYQWILRGEPGAAKTPA